MFRFLNNKIQKGFTLVEMIVVLAIFSVATVEIVDIFMMAGRAQRRALAVERIQSDARYSMEAISHEIRMDSIDYAWYASLGGVTVPENKLALRDADNNSIIFEKSGPNYPCPSGTGSCLLVSLDGGNNWASITSSSNTILDLKFYINPLIDPFTLNAYHGYDSDNQPRVTIELATQGVGVRPDEQQTVYLQTTVSSRIYRR
jgi:prepilin-type N-terminal cleavage/methylation domain-containing protein